jgi:hypothetical protein
VFVPVTLMEWKSSGPDSGPPTENFLVFFVRWAADPLTAVYPLAGLVTAGLYWWLASRSRCASLPALGRDGIPLALLRVEQRHRRIHHRFDQADTVMNGAALERRRHMPHRCRQPSASLAQ